MLRRSSRKAKTKESDREFFLRASNYADAILGRKRKRKRKAVSDGPTFSLLPSMEFNIGNVRITYIYYTERVKEATTHALFVKYIDGGVLYNDEAFKGNDNTRFEYIHQHVTEDYIITKIPLSVNMVGSAETCLHAIVYPYFKHIYRDDRVVERIKEWVIINKLGFIHS